MPGPRQPTDLVKARGKKHFSQTEEDQRRDQEVHVQPPDRAEPPRWLGKKFHAEFREIGEILRQAGIADADLLIAATSQDEINLLCCLSAHRINKNIHTIARIRNPDYANQIYEMRETFALSLSVNPDKQAAAEIDRLLKYPGFLKREPFARGRGEIAEL